MAMSIEERAFLFQNIFFYLFVSFGIAASLAFSGILTGSPRAILLLVLGVPTAVFFVLAFVTSMRMVEESFKELDKARGSEI